MKQNKNREWIKSSYPYAKATSCKLYFLWLLTTHQMLCKTLDDCNLTWVQISPVQWHFVSKHPILGATCFNPSPIMIKPITRQDELHAYPVCDPRTMSHVRSFRGLPLMLRLTQATWCGAVGQWIHFFSPLDHLITQEEICPLCGVSGLRSGGGGVSKIPK